MLQIPHLFCQKMVRWLIQEVYTAAMEPNKHLEQEVAISDSYNETVNGWERNPAVSYMLHTLFAYEMLFSLQVFCFNCDKDVLW